MTFPETVKTTLWDIIDEMSLSLSSMSYSNFSTMILLFPQDLLFTSNAPRFLFLHFVIF